MIVLRRPIKQDVALTARRDEGQLVLCIWVAEAWVWLTLEPQFTVRQNSSNPALMRVCDQFWLLRSSSKLVT
jgi:hypothetical protein